MDYTERMQTIPYEKMIVFIIIFHISVTTDKGRIPDVFVMIGLKSYRSRLILIVHMICNNTSFPMDSFIHFLHNFSLSV